MKNQKSWDLGKYVGKNGNTKRRPRNYLLWTLKRMTAITLATICLTNTKLVNVSAELSNNAYIPDFIARNSDIEYLARCVEAEAGNQDWMGKAYVCDVILNRIDYYGYGSYEECINQTGQFECVSNGMINSVVPNESTYLIILRELKNRSDYDIMYFRTIHYHSFGTPKFQHGDHYFSTR